MTDAAADDANATVLGKAESTVARPASAHPETAGRSPTTTWTIERLEETAVVAKRVRATGTLSVRVVTEAFEETVAVDLSAASAQVERVPIDRIVDTIPETRVEDGVTIVPVFEEVLVVERRIRLVEELHIRHETSSESVRLPVTVRRQRAVVERLPVDSRMPTPSNEE